jgi:hypothetical protein
MAAVASCAALVAARPLVLPSAPHGIRTLVDHACAVARVELSAERERESLHARTKKLDFEPAVGDGLRLPD